jgi:hypothetical protein
MALAPVIADIKASGITTPYTIAAELVRRGIPTARGHRFWSSSVVGYVLKRLDRLWQREPDEPSEGLSGG